MKKLLVIVLILIFSVMMVLSEKNKDSVIMADAEHFGNINIKNGDLIIEKNARR